MVCVHSLRFKGRGGIANPFQGVWYAKLFVLLAGLRFCSSLDGGTRSEWTVTLCGH